MLWEAVENRKGAVKPRPLCTPLGLFFRSSWVVVWGTVLTFVCMLRYWMRNVVPRRLQWNCNEVLDVRCTSAEFCSPCGVQPGAAIYAAYAAEVPQPMRHIQPEFRNLCGIYGGVSAIYIMQQYILQKYTKFRSIYFGSVSNCRYRSIQAQVSIFPHSTIAALYKKRPSGVQRGAALCPFAVFLHSNVIYPLRGPQPMCHTAGIRNLCGYTTGVPQPMRHIRPRFRNPCGHSAGASAAHAVIISPYKI